VKSEATTILITNIMEYGRSDHQRYENDPDNKQVHFVYLSITNSRWNQIEPIEQEIDVFAQPNEQETDMFANTMRVQNTVPAKLELFYLDAIQFEVTPDKIGTEPFFMDAEEYEEVKEPDTFYFFNAVQDKEDYGNDLFGDPTSNMSPRNRLGRAFHLSIDPNLFIREGRIYDFLDKMDNQALLGNNGHFDSLGFMVESVKKQVHGYGMQTKSTVKDAKRIQPYLGYWSLNVIRHMLAHTMLLVSQLLRILLQRHVKSMFPFL
jgi:hypothetical protein